jgi:phospholipase D1/2
MIDGDMYFRNVAEEIEKAEHEIFISDWWLCPKYYLVRPVSILNQEDNERYRLDMLLLSAVSFYTLMISG